jgi:hypothetical protein
MAMEWGILSFKDGINAVSDILTSLGYLAAVCCWTYLVLKKIGKVGLDRFDTPTKRNPNPAG